MTGRSIFITSKVYTRNEPGKEYQGILGVPKQMNQILGLTLQQFAKEVRRRARIRLAVNRVHPEIPDFRKAKHLKDTIEFDVDTNKMQVNFDVGRGLPYAEIEDQAQGKRTIIYGNPTMKFYWYAIGQPMRIRRPNSVVRRGKNFFTGAMNGTIGSFEKIFDKVAEKEWAKEFNR